LEPEGLSRLAHPGQAGTDPADAVLGDRSHFPRLRARAYLAHAAISPTPDFVERAIVEQVAATAAQGLGAIGALLDNAALARARFAALIGADPADVAAIANTSSAAAAVASAMDWRAKDRILTFEDEFPANVTPWQAAAGRCGLAVVRVPIAPFTRSAEEGLEAVRKELDRGGARLIAVSGVQFQTGLAMPVARLARLAREHGAELFVDAIQAVGARPVDVRAEGVHYLAAGSHKWLMGQLGAAFLWIDPRSAERLEPQLVGWTSHESPDAFLGGPASALRHDRPLVRGARVFEAGVLNHLGLAAAAAGMAPLIALGPGAIHAHVQTYHDLLEPGLVELGFVSRRAARAEGRSAILSLDPPAEHGAADIARALLEAGVVASAPCGLLRLAPHWPNPLDEVPAVLRAVRAALAV